MQFDRVVRVDIGPAGGAGKSISDVRVEFECVKTIQAGGNTATVRLYNLLPETRAKLIELHQTLLVYAGYREEAGAKLIFRGAMSYSVSKHRPPEWITELRVGDGAKALREKRIKLSLAPGCKIGEACNATVKEIGFPLVDEDAVAEADGDFAGGFSYIGPADDALREITAAGDLEYSVQDEQIQILPRNGTLKGQAVLLSPSTGLLDSPEPLVQPRKKLSGAAPKVQWGLRCLLNPLLVPGGAVQVDSAGLSGFFRIENVKHVGDTHGDDWYSALEVARYAAA